MSVTIDIGGYIDPLFETYLPRMTPVAETAGLLGLWETMIESRGRHAAQGVVDLAFKQFKSGFEVTANWAVSEVASSVVEVLHYKDVHDAPLVKPWQRAMAARRISFIAESIQEHPLVLTEPSGDHPLARFGGMVNLPGESYWVAPLIERGGDVGEYERALSYGEAERLVRSWQDGGMFARNCSEQWAFQFVPPGAAVHNHVTDWHPTEHAARVARLAQNQGAQNG